MIFCVDRSLPTDYSNMNIWFPTRCLSQLFSFLLAFLICIPYGQCNDGGGYALGPLSQYCRFVQNQLIPICSTQCTWEKPVTVQFGIDNSGTIGQVTVLQANGQLQDTQAAVRLVQMIRAVAAPPPAVGPTQLIANISHNPDDVTVSLQSFDPSMYMADVNRHIKRGWHPATSGGRLRTSVSFKIYADGNLSGLQLEQSSGSPQFDNEAMQAVQAAAPFRPLPDGAGEKVYVSYTFDSANGR